MRARIFLDSVFQKEFRNSRELLIRRKLSPTNNLVQHQAVDAREVFWCLLRESTRETKEKWVD